MNSNSECLKIVDCHSHFGIDNFWPNHGTINEYIENTQPLGINEVFAMSVACPVINGKNFKKILSLHRLENNEIKHYYVESIDEKTLVVPNAQGVNPYKLANDYIYNLSKSNCKLKINYVPLIHPYYYSIDDMLEHIKRGAKMFKIHGIACGVIPELISEDFFKLLEHCGVALLIHTDYSEEENLLSCNSAQRWLNKLSKYNIKVYFAHGARLDREVASTINSDDRYIVGLGPDKLLSHPGQNKIISDNFAECCFNLFNINKIVFDIDYPWNIRNVDDYSYDWDSVNRIISLLNKGEQEKVLTKNIKKFLK